MKYQIRKVEQYTDFVASPVIELDCEDFRQLDENPYTGNSEEEFMEYIAALDFKDPPYDLESKVADSLMELEEAEWKQYASTAEKYRNVVLQIGVNDEDHYKTGGFKVSNQTDCL